MTTTDTRQSGAFDLASFKPSVPNYQPTRSVSDQLRNDDRADDELAEFDGTTIVDDGWNRWHLIVTSGTPNFLTLQLQVADVITWWKGIEIHASLFGSWFSINKHLGTVNDTRTATINLSPADAQSSTLKLDFWKAGFLNTGSYLFTQILDVPSNLGKTYIYLCSRDHPSQP